MSSMNVKRFIETNVLIYACDSSDPRKQQIALAALEGAATAGTGVISVQVLGEFFHATVVRRRIFSAVELERAVNEYRAAFTLAPVEFANVVDAMAIHRRYQTRYWDSLVVATAVRSGCAEILSEDFTEGQSYNGVVVVNPFREGAKVQWPIRRTEGSKLRGSRLNAIVVRDHARRRSRVKGKSRLGISGGGMKMPCVAPWVKKRARRRLSAS